MSGAPPELPPDIAPLLCCPACRAPLVAAVERLRCASCGREGRWEAGYLDLLGTNSTPASLAQRAMQWWPLVRAYESFFRKLSAYLLAGRLIDFDSECALAEEVLGVGQRWPTVDLSCGPGVYARRFAAAVPEHTVIGIDISGPMLSEAARLSAAANLTNIVYVRADAASLPLRDGSVAGINNAAALHLYPDKKRVLGEVCRALAPGGTYLCLTLLRSHRWPLGGVAAVVERALGVNRPGEAELRRMVSAAGLVGFRRIILGPFIVFWARRPAR